MIITRIELIDFYKSIIIDDTKAVIMKKIELIDDDFEYYAIMRDTLINTYINKLTLIYIERKISAHSEFGRPIRIYKLTQNEINNYVPKYDEYMYDNMMPTEGAIRRYKIKLLTNGTT